MDDPVDFGAYHGEHELPELVKLIDKDLSEPYSVFTYRYFLFNWPELCVLARVKNKLIGAIVCRLEPLARGEHEPTGKNDAADSKGKMRGYIAMLAVDNKFRQRGIGSDLVRKAVELLYHTEGCEEVSLETETSNKGAIRLYENLGFVRDERLFRYYLNGNDAFRLKLWFR